MVQVLFVCLGNICRSPMAEGLFIHHVREAGLEDQFNIDSAGTGGWHTGEPADSRMRQVAGNHGIKLPSVSRKVQASDFEQFDYILAMDQRNFEDLKSMQADLGDTSARVIKMRQFDPVARDADVPDPYYGGDQGFEDVYQMLDRSTQELLSHVKDTFHLNS